MDTIFINSKNGKKPDPLVINMETYQMQAFTIDGKI